MMFHQRSQKIFRVGFIVLSILVIVSMILLYFPAIRY